MKVKAFQIVDFNNPLSVEYFEYSQTSFSPVKDVIDITPVQATIPSTLQLPKIYGDDKKRSDYEKACFESHYNLVKKLATGNSFFILEHDAYLWPERIDIFYELIDNYDTYSVFYIGIANEFYTMRCDVARNYTNIVERGQVKSGPMGTVIDSQKGVISPIDSLKLWPVKGQKNLICSSLSLSDAANGEGILYPAPVTQHLIIDKGSTIITRKNNWVYSVKNNPDMYITYKK